MTPERLAQVGQAEAALRRAGFRVVRVRHHGEIARIELGEGERDRFRVAAVRAEVVRSMKDAGFRYAVVDLEAYRSGGAGPEANEPRLYSIETPRDRGQ